jgi:predicted small secreted protein
MSFLMKIKLLIAVLAASGLFGSCNTMIGVGRDMRILGEQMENSSNKARGQAPEGDVSGAPVY